MKFDYEVCTIISQSIKYSKGIYMIYKINLQTFNAYPNASRLGWVYQRKRIPGY
jgi:hypothetical protein